ncbi:MAG TPA: FAD-dependent oxidoreductase [Burkholderiaceae bacterium]|nr:FAD-dependent oxidoreductase [Burkholderiaceae bacterium]
MSSATSESRPDVSETRSDAHDPGRVDRLGEVAVIGAGIVGCCIAYELRKRGAAVTLVDRDEPGRGCSYGNSGAISESSVVPLAMPGVLSSVPSMLLDPRGPLYLPLGHLPFALPWLMRFVASSRPPQVEQAARALASLHAGAMDKHESLAREVGVPEVFLRRGHLYVYPDRRALAKDAAGWALRKRYGFRFDELDRAGILELEPRIGPRYQVGVFLADHATIRNPFRYVQAIAAAFVARAGRVQRQRVRAIRPLPESRWRLHHEGGSQDFDHVVVAAGMGTDRLLWPLGLRLGLQSQRGYHVQYHGGPQAVSRTVVLADRKVFVTPMEDGVRVGGTVEIGGLRRLPDPRRSDLLDRIARETFEGFDGVPSTRWMGHRPCMPDSVPIVGPAKRQPGLWIAAGHGHLGLTDSVGTAERIANGMLAAG